MNRIYSLVWNRSRKQVEVASELVRGHGGGGNHGAAPGARCVAALGSLAGIALAIGMALNPWVTAGAQAAVGYEQSGIDYCASNSSAIFDATCTPWGGAFNAFTGPNIAYLSGTAGETAGGVWAADNNAGLWFGAGPENSTGTGSRIWVYADNASVQGATVNLLSTNGVNVDNQQIHNLAAGVAPADAVNVAQLQAQETHYYSVNDAGVAGSNYDNDGALGANSLAAGVGASTTADATNAVAVGFNAIAQGGAAVSIGGGNTANGAGAVTIGGGGANLAMGPGVLAIGNGNTAGNTAGPTVNPGGASGAVALGYGNYAGDYFRRTFLQSPGDGAVAIGLNNSAQGASAIAIGSGSQATISHFFNIPDDSGAVAIGTAASANTGSLAMGANANASQGSVAIGGNAIGTGFGVSVGWTAQGGSDSVAIGENARADLTKINSSGTNSSVAIGNGAEAYMSDITDLGGMVAIGGFATVSRSAGIAIGSRANVSAPNGLALGLNAAVSGANGIALGNGARAQGGDSISIGTGNVVSGTSSGAFGDPNSVTGNDSYAFGNNNTIANDNTFVLGNAVTTTQDNSVVLGNASADRAATTVTGDTINGTAYTYAGPGSAANGMVSVGGVGTERQVINVAAGEVNATSTDAINGSQLFATDSAVTILGTTVTNLGNSVAGGMGGTSSYDPTTGTVTTGLDVGGTTYTNVNDAINAVDATANAGWNVMTAATGTGVANGASVANVGPGQTMTLTASDNLITTQNGTDVAIGLNPVLTGLTSIAFAGGGPVISNTGIDMGGTRIINLADGTDPGDAVNVSQLDSVVAGAKTHYYSVNDGGVPSGNYDNDGATGTYSLAAGVNTTAAGGYATAVGFGANALGDGSLALGANSIASNANDVALGSGSVTGAANPTASTTIGGTTYNFAGANPQSVVSVGSVGDERQITNVAAGQLSASSTDAVNGSQLYATNQAIDAVGTVANAGWNLSANGGTPVNIKPGATVDVAQGNNIVVTQAADGSLTIATSMTPVFTSVTAGNSTLDNGGLTVNDGTHNTSYGADGMRVTNGPSVTSAGIDAGHQKITNVADGTAASDAVNVGQLTNATGDLQTQINNINQGGSGMFQSSTDSTGSPAATGKNSAAGGANATASGTDSVAVGNGSTASGDQSTALGTASTASGTGSTALGDGASATGDNSVALGAGSVASGDNTVSVGSAGNERQITNVAAGTAPTDAVNVSQLQASQKGGVQYDTNADGTTDYNSVTLNPGGTGPAVIHNVATGVGNNDAVNVGQLNTAIAGAVNTANNYTDQRYNELKGSMSQIGNRANAGIASAIAAASLPQPYAPNQSSLGVGLGSFRGEAGIAVGLSKITESGRFILKANVSSDTRGDVGAGVGAGIVW